MLLAGETSIREVIAFPKTRGGFDPLTGAPTPITAQQRLEAGIDAKPKPAGGAAATPAAWPLPEKHQQRYRTVRLLVIGASGYVGRHVARRALALGHGTSPARTRPGRSTFAGVRVAACSTSPTRIACARSSCAAAPEAIVPAAYAGAPTLAPIAPGLNWTANAVGAVNVARAAAETGARLVHVSSDAVHGGRPERYTEADDPAPVNPYGAAKAAAELGDRRQCSRPPRWPGCR